MYENHELVFETPPQNRGHGKHLALPLNLLRGACKHQLAIVRHEWPDGIPLTEETAQRAIALQLDLDWAVNKLLSTPARAKYERATAPARAKYRCATAPARAKYHRATAQAWAKYRRAATQAWAKYQRAAVQAWAKYQRAATQAWAKYEHATAQAWVKYERATAQALLMALRGDSLLT